ncbi:Nf-X1-Type Zinc Finger Protein Nfxl1 [Manis pentadactyla]|nr:Nf-X1-Type Zinc Finger Protein Nfxl1 [Manis pentadactyla]
MRLWVCELRCFESRPRGASGGWWEAILPPGRKLVGGPFEGPTPLDPTSGESRPCPELGLAQGPA